VVRECISSLGGAHDFNFAWSKFIVVFPSIRIEKEVISVSVIVTRTRIWAGWGACRAVRRQVQRSEAILFVLASFRRSRIASHRPADSVERRSHSATTARPRSASHSCFVGSLRLEMIGSSGWFDGWDWWKEACHCFLEGPTRICHSRADCHCTARGGRISPVQTENTLDENV